MRRALLVLALATAVPAAAQEAPPAPAPATGVEAEIDPHDQSATARIARLPADVRAKLTGDQIADILTQPANLTGHEMENLVIPIAFFGAILGVVAVVMVARARRDRRLHETLRAMIDKGVDIPPALLVAPQAPRDDRRRGILLATTGAGLAVFLYFVDRGGTGAWAAGLVPLFLGAGYLGAYALQRGSAPPASSSAGA